MTLTEIDNKITVIDNSIEKQLSIIFEVTIKNDSFENEKQY